jgi:hypothetical protein
MHMVGINFYTMLEGLDYNAILILTSERLHYTEILMLPLGGLHVKHAVQCGISVPTQHLL